MRRPVGRETWVFPRSFGGTATAVDPTGNAYAIWTVRDGVPHSVTTRIEIARYIAATDTWSPDNAGRSGAGWECFLPGDTVLGRPPTDRHPSRIGFCNNDYDDSYADHPGQLQRSAWRPHLLRRGTFRSHLDADVASAHHRGCSDSRCGPRDRGICRIRADRDAIVERNGWSRQLHVECPLRTSVARARQARSSLSPCPENRNARAVRPRRRAESQRVAVV